MTFAGLSDLKLASSSHLFPILAVAVFAICLIGERIFSLYLVLPMPRAKKFLRQLRELVAQGRVNEAIALCEKNLHRPLARVASAGLSRAHLGEASVRNGLELALSEALQRVAARTPFLATIANVSTLLGLCGTVLGLIRSFSSVGELSAQARGAAMAAGISTAMNSTLYGLAVAVVCMVAHSLLISRTAKLNAELERAAVNTLDIVIEAYVESVNLNQNKAA